MKERIAAFDIMKGVAIILVIVGHNQLIPASIPHWIYSFHMPLFFLLAGYLQTVTCDYATVFRKSFSRLLIPFFATLAILVLYNLLSSIRNDDWQIVINQFIYILFPTGVRHGWMGIPAPNDIGAIWFLVAYFWCRIVSNYLLSKGIPSVAIFVVALLAVFLDREVISLPFGILPGLSSMMFFVIGHEFKKKKISNALSLLCFACWVLAWFYSSLSMNVSHYRHLPIDVLGACGGTLFVYRLSRIIELYLPLSRKVWVWLGMNSMAVVCLHTVIRNCYLLEHFHLPEEWYVMLPFEIIVTVGAVWICSKIYFTKKIFQMS